LVELCLDFNSILQAIVYLKELDLDKEELTDSEYSLYNLVDAFVAMGGCNDKSGKIKKETLIQILKKDFELTVDMDVH